MNPLPGLRRGILPIGLALLAAAALAPACGVLLRERRTPFPSPAYAVPWGLNREFLLPRHTSRILFVVDHTAGVEPLAEPLDSLARLAGRYGERPSSWTRLGEAAAPAARWDSAGKLILEGALDPATSYVFIRYLGTVGHSYASTQLQAASEPSGARRSFYVIRVAQDVLARRRVLWLTRKRLEEGTLVHEYGHVLGLGRNPEHSRFVGGGHCVNPECPLASPTPRKIIYGIWRIGLTFRGYGDYCPACRKDIEGAKAFWRNGLAAPAPSGPAPEEIGRWVDRLPVRSFRNGGEADVLIFLGKAGMPALMKRMPRLPGGGERSPRWQADWIAKTVIMGEAQRRAGEGWIGSFEMGDTSAVTIDWWAREGERFMAGDRWELSGNVSLRPSSGD